MKKIQTIIVGGAVLAGLLGFSELRSRGAFARAAAAYRGVSAVNNSLVLSLTGELARGQEPGALAAALDSALSREQISRDSLEQSLPWWWRMIGWRAEVVFVREARAESEALQKISHSLGRLAELPAAEWSEQILILRQGTEEFNSAHRKIEDAR